MPLSSTLAGVIGAVAGLAPHVLHNTGPLEGTALIAGTGGTTVFGVPGLVAAAAAAPVRHLVGPAIGLAVFAWLFSQSAFVIGPAINSGGGPSGGGHPNPPVDHSGQYN